VLFIVNDRPDVARLAEADGVHLGQDDMSVREARRIVGPDALIGVSTHTVDQVRRAVLEGASYIGVGPTFLSATKQFDELAGLDFVRAVTAETTLPAFVLGGVTAENVARVISAGGRRIAVSAAIGKADDPRAAAAVLRRALGT
jgi:thiamine-phosphate pyrophosphorylase